MSDDERPTALPFKLTPIDPTEPDTRDQAKIETGLQALRAEHQPLIDEYAKLVKQARAASAGLLEPRLLCPMCRKGRVYEPSTGSDEGAICDYCGQHFTATWLDDMSVQQPKTESLNAAVFMRLTYRTVNLIQPPRTLEYQRWVGGEAKRS